MTLLDYLIIAAIVTIIAYIIIRYTRRAEDKSYWDGFWNGYEQSTDDALRLMEAGRRRREREEEDFEED